MAKGGARILWYHNQENQAGTEFLNLQVSSRVGNENQEGLPSTRYFAGQVWEQFQRAEDATRGGCDQTLEKRGDTEVESGVGRAQERMPWWGQSSRVLETGPDVPEVCDIDALYLPYKLFSKHCISH